ncbi:ABC transporter permease [Fusibacter paucivorans]|uniref:ABC transporter permease n=1 Tax=Fusibacter paucivorans TaxID=76009 RepID=A0ABS5PKM7_9FIRM|nr:ABC transporter permease [Fusibacter paucivorans]MBS7525581.1 ABC transporter permease [Fusibacter paucivorans]
MKHYLDLIPIVDKAHSRRRLMTKLCIVLSVFLVTAIFGMADMEMRSQYLQISKDEGNWHMLLTDIDEETAAIIATRPEVEHAGWYVSFASDSDSLLGKPLYNAGMSAEVLRNIFLTDLVEGTYPKHSDEVALSRNVRDQTALRTGDFVTLPSPSGGTQSFRITGFMDNTANLLNKDAYGMLLDVTTAKTYVNSTSFRQQYMIQFSKHTNMRKAIAEIRTAFDLTDDQINLNEKLLGVLGQSDYSYMKQLYIVAGVLGIVVLLAGVMMIASNLNSDIMQRTSFFGMLRCLGATKRQVMRFVRLEALSWCKMTIPIGVLSGTVVTWFLSAILKWLTPVYFDEMPTFAISWIGVGAGALIGLLSVLAASSAPARKAAQVSPLMAITGNAYMDGTAKSVKSAAKTQYLKVDTALGVQHAFTMKKNYALMLGSFGLSIILFLCFSATIDFLNHAIEPLRPWSEDIVIRSTNGDNRLPAALVDQIGAEANVKQVSGSRYLYDKADDNGNVFKVVTLDEAQWPMLKRYLLDGTVNSLQDGVDTALLLYSSENTMTTGDVINFDGADVRIMGVLSDSPVNATNGAMTLLCSEATLDAIEKVDGYERIDIILERGVSEMDVAAIRAMVDPTMHFSDNRLTNRQARGAYFSMALFIYGFLVIIALITLLNIVNGISISVSARIKQYGIMRAIGMTKVQIIRMIRAETMTYAVSGSVFGCIAGLPLHRWLYSMMVTSYWGTPWYVPIRAVALIVILVLATSVIAVYGPSKRIHNMSVVDTIATL